MNDAACNTISYSFRKKVDIYTKVEVSDTRPTGILWAGNQDDLCKFD